MENSKIITIEESKSTEHAVNNTLQVLYEHLIKYMYGSYKQNSHWVKDIRNASINLEKKLTTKGRLNQSDINKIDYNKAFEAAKMDATQILKTRDNIHVNPDTIFQDAYNDTVLDWFDIKSLIDLSKIGAWLKIHQYKNAYDAKQISDSLNSLFGI